MEYISSKNIVLLICDTLKLLDRTLIEHGERTAYIVYKMLEAEGSYELFEIADYAFLAMIHDMGAYKTEKMEDLILFETKNYMPHSIYGYLFLKYLSPLEKESKILLYHHINCEDYHEIDYPLLQIASYIYLADRLDIYHQSLGDSFSIEMLKKYEGTRYTHEAITLLEKAMESNQIISKLNDRSHLGELDELFDYIMFNNDDKKKYLDMLMQCKGLQNEKAVMETMICSCIAEEMGKKMYLTAEEMGNLYYGVLTHDIGMLAVPEEILHLPRKLTEEEMKIVRNHITMEEKILRVRLRESVADIAVAHHERADGSGYPKGLHDKDMNDSQRILQLADSVTAMISNRKHRKALKKEEVLKNIEAEVIKGHYNRRTAFVFTENYDVIMEKVMGKTEHLLEMNKKLDAQFQSAIARQKHLEEQ
ncbi:MAG: HD domain-containing protein [Lachnospiraceae bacterium]|nr:HD domain-containing protein [Lachnospiraceae bacterium]